MRNWTVLIVTNSSKVKLMLTTMSTMINSSRLSCRMNHKRWLYSLSVYNYINIIIINIQIKYYKIDQTRLDRELPFPGKGTRWLGMFLFIIKKNQAESRVRSAVFFFIILPRDSACNPFGYWKGLVDHLVPFLGNGYFQSSLV